MKFMKELYEAISENNERMIQKDTLLSILSLFYIEKFNNCPNSDYYQLELECKNIFTLINNLP